MEVVKVIPEDLQSKFKSKSDLYDLLSIDLRYYLPPFEKCPMHFLRKVMSGEKKIIKRAKVIDILVPRFKELSVENVWPLVKEVSDLYQYFPDYNPKQYPERSFMYSILATFRYEEVKNMVENARKNRALQNKSEKDDLIFVNKELFKEIESVFGQKLTNGKAVHLLKRSAKLMTERKPAKKYELTIGNLKKNYEENKNEDEMN